VEEARRRGEEVGASLLYKFGARFSRSLDDFMGRWIQKTSGEYLSVRKEAEGHRSTVMGLPIEEVKKELEKFTSQSSPKSQ